MANVGLNGWLVPVLVVVVVSIPGGMTLPQGGELLLLLLLLVKELPFEHTAFVRGQPPRRSRRGGDNDGERSRSVPPTTPKTVTLALDDGEGRGRSVKKSHAMKTLQHVVESDISMLMRKRAALAYGLADVRSSLLYTSNRCD